MTWSDATGLKLKGGNTCLFRVFGADSCFDGSLPNPASILVELGLDPQGWSHALCLVAPVPVFQPGSFRKHLSAATAHPTHPIDVQKRVDAMVIAAEQADAAALRTALQDPSLVVRREAALGLNQLGVHVRISGWTEGPFLERARRHPWGAALHRGEPLPALAALLALSVDEGIQPRALLCLASDIRMHRMFEAIARDTCARFPLIVRQHAAAALLLGGGVPEDPVLHRVLLADAPGDEPDLVAIAVQDPDAAVRLAAVHALRAGGWPTTALSRLAEMDPDPAVRAAVGRPKSDPISATIAPDPWHRQARGEGLAALSAIEPDLALQLAQSLIQDADPDLARVAAGLTAASTPTDQVHAQVETALPLLRYADHARRRIGIALLGGLALQQALREEVADALEELAAFDPDPEVQQDAMQVLERWACED